MRFPAIFLVLLLIASRPVSTQTQTQRKRAQQAGYVDPFGLPCAKILELSSSEYIAQIVAIDDSTLDGTLRGINKYGACYDARTDALAASLARSRKGPTKAARADLASFESALKNFTAKALAGTPRPTAIEREAYANLYEKQFQYKFYQQYEPKTVKPRAGQKETLPTNATASDKKSGAVSSSSGSQPSASDTDETTKAKNRFGELLGALPDERLHELHAAFGEVIGLHTLDNVMRLAVYRYAIFLLEPTTERPSYAPPF